MNKSFVFATVLITLFGCASTGDESEKKSETEEPKWMVIRSTNDFLSRYPSLSTDYFNQVRYAELLFEEGEKKRVKFEPLTKKEDYTRRVQLREEAKSYYLQALNEAKKIFDATGSADVARLIATITAPLEQVQREIESERGLIK
ncbi:MAG: hypothetical protein N2234_06625 [Planctomycetota bacterium]|nr:hypothetical protein [Planctomycetota bacterium]